VPLMLLVGEQRWHNAALSLIMLSVHRCVVVVVVVVVGSSSSFGTSLCARWDLVQG
jgi:hypothetical protein